MPLHTSEDPESTYGSWPDKDANKLDAARRATAELTRIVIQGEKIIPKSENTGYGNYGE